MLDDIQAAVASSRARFAVSVAIFIVLFVGWNIYCQRAQLTGDIRLVGDVLHDFLLVALCALRFRYLRLQEAWSLLAFVPIVNLGVVIFLLAKGDQVAERYSGG